MTKRKSTALFAATVLITISVVFSGIPSAAAQSGKTVDFFLATSGPGSSFYPLSVALAEVWKKNIPGLNVSLAPGGGVGSVVATGTAKAHVGMTLSSAAVDGIKGRPPFPGPHPNVRALASLDPQAFQFLAYKRSGITKFEELRGKRVYVKPKRFAAHAINLLVMKVHGMTLKSLSKAETVSKPDAINLFKDGHVDAMLWMGPVPDSLIMNASFNRPINLLRISDAKKQEIRKINPGIVPHVLPKGLYPGVDEDFQTLAVPRVLVMSKDVSDDKAYSLAKTLVEKWEDLKLSDPGLKLVKVSSTATDFGVTYHPGAAKYYKERGWMK